jgi:hypothetical protein
LPSLTNGRQVVLAEFGHTADLWKVNPAATERLLTSFFDTGVADSSLYQYAPMDFQASPRLPTLAKLLLGFRSGARRRRGGRGLVCGQVGSPAMIRNER